MTCLSKYLCHPPLFFPFWHWKSSVGHKKPLQLQGVGPRLWSVFSVSLLSLMTDQLPLRLIQYQDGIKRLPCLYLSSLTPTYSLLQINTLKTDLTEHSLIKMTTHKNLRKAMKSLEPVSVPMQGQTNVRDFHGKKNLSGLWTPYRDTELCQAHKERLSAWLLPRDWFAPEWAAECECL